MELLELTPPDYGVRTRGIYIIDDNGMRVCAGPFSTDTAAIAWLEAKYTRDQGTQADTGYPVE